MQYTTEYRFLTTSEAMGRIAAILEKLDCFEDVGSTVILDVMEKIIKIVHEMETSGHKDSFIVVGTQDSDYDRVIFEMAYTGTEPLIKVLQAEAGEEEEDIDYDECIGAAYGDLCCATFEEIPELLDGIKTRTFKQAIEDGIPLGGFLSVDGSVSYDSWVKSILDGRSNDGKTHYPQIQRIL